MLQRSGKKSTALQHTKMIYGK